MPMLIEVRIQCDGCGNELNEKYPATSPEQARRELTPAGWLIKYAHQNNGFLAYLCPECH